MTKGEEIYQIAERLFPLDRSITGEGNRETLRILQEYDSDLKIIEVPSGTEVFDWTVPKEWRVNEAYIENSKGERIVDFADNNLCLLGYSYSMDEKLSKDQMKEFVFTLDSQPDLIPYTTSYYKERRGFCMSKNSFDALPEDTYHLYIDADHFDGSLSIGELVIPGETNEEIFIPTYICHPSMANDNISGPALLIKLAEYIKALPKRRYTYRLVLHPETIGAITYISLRLEELKKNVIAGFNLTCVGDDNDYSLVHSPYADTLADKVLANVLKYVKTDFSEYSFLDRGSDERQYCSPKVGLPLVCFCRSKFGEYPEYHTSADDMSYVSSTGFQGAYDVMTKVIDALEYNKKYSVKVTCEVQLGKRDLIPTFSQKGTYDAIYSITRFLAYADGKNDLIDISNIIGVPVSELIQVVKQLEEKDIFE